MIARRKDARRRRGWLRVPPSCIERACIIFQKGAREKYPRYSGFACRPPEAPSIGNKYPDFPYHRHQHTYCSSSSLSLFFDFFFCIYPRHESLRECLPYSCLVCFSYHRPCRPSLTAPVRVSPTCEFSSTRSEVRYLYFLVPVRAKPP